VIIWGNFYVEGLAAVLYVALFIWKATKFLDKGKRRAGLVARVPRDDQSAKDTYRSLVSISRSALWKLFYYVVRPLRRS
jgi:hypothetical protein